MPLFKPLSTLIKWLSSLIPFIHRAITIGSFIIFIILALMGYWGFMGKESCEQLVIQQIHFKGTLLAKKSSSAQHRFIVIDSLGSPKQIALPDETHAFWAMAQKGDLVIKKAWSNEIQLLHEGKIKAFHYGNNKSSFRFNLYEYGFFDLADTAYYYCLNPDKNNTSQSIYLDEVSD
ncbi:hypothetical protein PPO43_10905 [Saprospira sp. CCB-QB6]|uniref:hypothetical protein n=1 Tax=Saprospira sp. CCB-QB6 TaxID=3023936 RepID=UPI00234A1245|nr:hypothetical protein [Saprospira sp. CCB-QB6]WCL80476.1 hypothetical protein PPO43_10905 [Saprospira sp. CCB-QB6]